MIKNLQPVKLVAMLFLSVAIAGCSAKKQSKKNIQRLKETNKGKRTTKQSKQKKNNFFSQSIIIEYK